MQPLKTTTKIYSISVESIDSISEYRRDDSIGLNWCTIFMLPEWLKIWWKHFSTGYTQKLLSVREDTLPIGIAPLMTRQDTAYLVGSIDVCDYLDFIVVPGKEQPFFNEILDYLKSTGIEHLDLQCVRPDSIVFNSLIEIAEKRGLSVECVQLDVSSELNLPPTWDAYLGELNGKQRHEIRRKLRRLREAAAVSYRSISGIDEIREFVDIFFDLFTQSRDDKAAFLTPQMRLFFSDLINDLFPLGLLKLNVLEMDDRPAAMVICFDYGDTTYLYNNGFDIRYRNLSVGTLCKAFSIQESIELGKKKYDFLKGAEIYKQRMGGREMPLYRCRIRIS